jgi:hypothetical protein
MKRWIFIVFAACSLPDGHAPIARITATPLAIPEHDSFQTDVVLDGEASADPIDDPDGGLPLGYRWTIVNDEFRFTAGTDANPRPTVRFLGAHPAIVSLTVTDETGLSDTATIDLQLTIPQP